MEGCGVGVGVGVCIGVAVAAAVGVGTGAVAVGESTGPPSVGLTHATNKSKLRTRNRARAYRNAR